MGKLLNILGIAGIAATAVACIMSDSEEKDERKYNFNSSLNFIESEFEICSAIMKFAQLLHIQNRSNEKFKIFINTMDQFDSLTFNEKFQYLYEGNVVDLSGNLRRDTLDYLNITIG